jgi:hypothetical protein
MNTPISRFALTPTRLAQAIMLLSILILSLSGPDNAEPALGQVVAQPKEPSLSEQQGVLREVERRVGAPFLPSLEMKENADWLLTPALLVQEVISEDVVVTYPSE